MGKVSRDWDEQQKIGIKTATSGNGYKQKRESQNLPMIASNCTKKSSFEAASYEHASITKLIPH